MNSARATTPDLASNLWSVAKELLDEGAIANLLLAIG